MTVQIGDVAAEISNHDQFTLHTMARAVLQNRPSFRSIVARVGERPVEIYTRYERQREAGGEWLVLSGAGTERRLGAADRAALERLLGDTR